MSEPSAVNWEIIPDNLSKAGFGLGWVSAIDLEGRTIGIVDAQGYGKRFIVRGDEIRTGTANGDTCVRGEFDAEKLTAGFGTGFATYQDAARCTTTPYIFD